MYAQNSVNTNLTLYNKVGSENIGFALSDLTLYITIFSEHVQTSFLLKFLSNITEL